MHMVLLLGLLCVEFCVCLHARVAFVCVGLGMCVPFCVCLRVQVCMGVCFGIHTSA
jgi:hypothetical protein